MGVAAAQRGWLKSKGFCARQKFFCSHEDAARKKVWGLSPQKLCLLGAKNGNAPLGEFRLGATPEPQNFQWPVNQPWRPVSSRVRQKEAGNPERPLTLHPAVLTAPVTIGAPAQDESVLYKPPFGAGRGAPILQDTLGHRQRAAMDPTLLSVTRRKERSGPAARANAAC